MHLLIGTLDTSTAAPGKDTYFFLSNAVDPSYTSVTPGSTNFNLFSFTTSTNTATFLDSASSVQVAEVPEPSSVLGVLAFGVAGGVAMLRKKVASLSGTK